MDISIVNTLQNSAVWIALLYITLQKVGCFILTNEWLQAGEPVVMRGLLWYGRLIA